MVEQNKKKMDNNGVLFGCLQTLSIPCHTMMLREQKEQKIADVPVAGKRFTKLATPLSVFHFDWAGIIM